MLRQPVEEEFTQSPAHEHAEDADEGDKVAELFLLHAEKLFAGQPAEHQVAQHKSADVGEPIPAQGERGAGNIDDNRVQVVNVGGNNRHDGLLYSTGQGVETRQKFVARVREIGVQGGASFKIISKKWYIMKILLAKRGHIVYKYSTRLFLSES